MLPLVERLKNKEVLICDGAMGTSVQAMGLEPGEAPEQWNISNSGAVKKVHKSFIGAGCDMIVTNTFGGNLIKLKKAGLENKFELLNRKAVEIAKDAAGDKDIYVIGDIGPTGEFIRPVGNCSEEEFFDTFFEQAEILAKSGVGAFIIETMSALDELKIAVTACKKAANLPVIATMTFNAGEKGYKTMMGVSIEHFVNEILVSECDVIGANCGCGSRQMVEIMAQMRKIAGKGTFLIAQPNAGMPKLINGKTVFNETAPDFAKAILELKKIGVNIIGGCCGTTPGHIREIVKIVKIPNHKSQIPNKFQ